MAIPGKHPRDAEAAPGALSNSPGSRTLRLLPDNDRLRWLYVALDGKPNAVKKRLILLARTPEVDFLDDRTAEILIHALGLEAA